MERAEGQDKRAAARFALIAMAGELAAEYGIVPWPEGTAYHAAIAGFQAWRKLRGPGNDEPRQILDRVNAFIERHGDSRFSNLTSDNPEHIRDRAGWWQSDLTNNSRSYLFTADGLREAVTGFDFRRVLDVLQAAGALPQSGERGKRRRQYKIAGRKMRLYPILAEKLEVTGQD